MQWLQQEMMTFDRYIGNSLCIKVISLQIVTLSMVIEIWAIVELLCRVPLCFAHNRKENRLSNQRTQQRGTMAPRPTEEEDMGYGDMDYGALAPLFLNVIQI